MASTAALPAPLPDCTRTRRPEAELRDLLTRRILVLDGAMGTMIHALNLEAKDFGGDAHDGCNEALCLTRPDLIRGIHEGYFQAGADMVETNTFGGTPLVLGEFDLRDRAYDINLAAARIARQAAAKYSTPAKPRFVAGALGPTTKTLSVTGGIGFDEMTATYFEQVRGLVDGGVDVLLIETCLDTLNLKTAAIAARRYFAESGVRLPLMISGTIEAMGTMLAGQPVEALYTSVEHFEPLSIGLNCSTGPEFMTHHIRTLSELARTHVSCYPNAGLPDEEGQFNETPELISSKLERFVVNGWLNVVGGCCGTTPEHIRLIADMAAGKAPRQVPNGRRLLVSGTEFLQIEEDNRPVIVGERTNSIGSRKFKDLIAQEKFEEAAEIGRKQVKAGAQVVDVCLANPDRDEAADMDRFLPLLVRKVKAPVMVDSTDAKVIELSLKYLQGKAIINSVNLEDGEERFAHVCPLARTYGAALVVGCIDEDKQQGMGVTVERKLAIARRSYALLTQKYGIPATDIIFDPLVFPCASGDKNYVGSAAATIEGIEAIRDALPDTRTILGISNVSFGLPESSREVLNSVFLYHCTRAGLDFAIVNSEKLARYASIPPREREAAEDLLYARRDDAIEAFAAFFRGAKKKTASPEDAWAHLPVEQRISRRVVEGTKEGLIDNLNLALEKYTPLEVINGPLMAGMDEVGRLFGANELIVAEVLQSAEVMKASIAHLEQFMDKNSSSVKAKFLLATVKGDVHDIGKNLVEIIFSNNGYRVINLGIKVASETLIQAFREHAPTAIGLSGLLVKSAQQMVSTAADLRNAKISVPLFVGGAALTKKFTYAKIAPEFDGMTIYAKDAMEGLDLANRLFDPMRRPELEAHVKAEQERFAGTAARAEARPAACTPRKASIALPRNWEVKSPPDLKRHVLRDYPLDEIVPYINPQMLYSKHLGLRGNVQQLVQQKDEKALKLLDMVAYVEEAAQSHRWIRPHALWRFFPARAEGNDVVLLSPDARSEAARFRFARQTQGDGLCLADYLAPSEMGKQDYVALFVTSAGEGLREHVERFKTAGEYLKCHALQALAIESAEAFAELLHAKLRAMWGFPDPPELTMHQRFGAHYHGLRVSFGYPACPRLEDQEILFRLLQPEEIGVQLTEGFMMEPEASVSALVFQHPAARYFSVDAEGLRELESAIGTGR